MHPICSFILIWENNHSLILYPKVCWEISVPPSILLCLCPFGVKDGIRASRSFYFMTLFLLCLSICAIKKQSSTLVRALKNELSPELRECDHVANSVRLSSFTKIDDFNNYQINWCEWFYVQPVACLTGVLHVSEHMCGLRSGLPLFWELSLSAEHESAPKALRELHMWGQWS